MANKSKVTVGAKHKAAAVKRANKDGRKVKTEAHKKAISEGLKRYHATKSKNGRTSGKPVTGGKPATQAWHKNVKPPKKDFSAWHAAHEAGNRAAIKASKALKASPEGKRISEIDTQVFDLQRKLGSVRLQARFESVNSGKKSGTASKKMATINKTLRKLSAERKLLREQYNKRTKKAKTK